MSMRSLEELESRWFGVKDLFLFEQPLSHVLAWNILRDILRRGRNSWKAEDGLPAAGLNGVDVGDTHEKKEKEFRCRSQRRYCCRHFHFRGVVLLWNDQL